MATSDPWARVVRTVDRRNWIVPLGIYLIGAALYVWLAAGRVGPIVANDEYLYGSLRPR